MGYENAPGSVTGARNNQIPGVHLTQFLPRFKKVSGKNNEKNYQHLKYLKMFCNFAIWERLI